jgi:hypothetical protein
MKGVLHAPCNAQNLRELKYVMEDPMTRPARTAQMTKHSCCPRWEGDWGVRSGEPLETGRILANERSFDCFFGRGFH